MKILIMLAALGGWQTQYTTQTQYQRQCQGGYCQMVPVQVQVPTSVWVPDPPKRPPALTERPKPITFRFY